MPYLAIPVQRGDRLRWDDPPDPPQPVTLQERDLVLLDWLAELRYLTTAQAAWLVFPDLGTARHRLLRLHRGGYVRRARLRWPTAPTTVWAPTAAVGPVLCAATPDGAVRWAEWTPPNGQALGRSALYHELARTEACQYLLDAARARGWSSAWLPPRQGAIRAAAAGARVELMPDAVLILNDAVWYLEYERSWRRETLEHKLRAYTLLWRYELWRVAWDRPPRCLLVPEGVSTQRRDWAGWLATVEGARRGWVVVLPQAALGTDWQAQWWDRDGQAHTASWWSLDPSPAAAVSRPLPPRRRS